MDAMAYQITGVPIVCTAFVQAQIKQNFKFRAAAIAYHRFAMREISINSTSLYETN